mmetsp:Transcript_9076/g.10579  ORF Transcript_9076/g.10579 Transcript_9076/m.10579 type:complete len:227 (-) Transcript_9076:130-810(-)|eukprot:CAMPEP_0204833782 /NCGR_PEP_ID=MMETSP1346-20131115/17748_1 /ASSEMBLY_ACC=CAM_ASM_000771 /TAXON_ID=215587 /ORGANISM="Aplanochytrium stocchinoi, Strain GSBS06" /LENGTH=226 /DNA_ID=CAMNT_0051966553 /DNA_START=29 /DNA_END=709 /DNA_ORIENTATION=-
MKFRICGDLEAPDWVLAEVAVVSEMSQKDVLILTKTVIDIFLSDKNKSAGDCDSPQDVLALLEARKFAVKSKSDTMATVALLRYIVTHSVKYQVDDTIVIKELEQIGLKTSHCNAIIGPFRLHRPQIQQALISRSLHLSQISKGEPPSWRLNYTLSTKALPNVNSASVFLNIPIKNVTVGAKEKPNNLGRSSNNKDLSFAISGQKLKALVHELRSAREVMRKFDDL